MRTAFLLLSFLCVLLASGCTTPGLGTANVPVSGLPGPASGLGISILSVTPGSGLTGSTVTITGTGFGVEQGDGNVYFGATEVSTVTSWSNTQIVVEVPSSAVTSAVKVTNTLGNSVTATGSFGVFTWTGQNTPTTADLYGSSFISENLGFAVGYKNFLFFRDGAWSRTEVTTMDMRALSILSATKGYAAGGTVAVPSNGLVYTYDGTSWTLLAGTGGTIAGAFLNGVSFVDTNTGWIVGDNSLIRKTTTGGTGGTPWSAQTAPVAGLSLKAVQFLDANNGWIVGSSGAIFNTTNGTDWATQTSGTGNTLFALHMLSATDGWAVGANGTVLHYSSGTWSASTVGGAAYHAVYFLDANQGLIGGTDGVVYTTANGGATWTQEDSGISSTITDFSFITRSQGWAVGGGGNVRYYHQVY